MEELRQINDEHYTPLKGDNLILDNRTGILLDDEFTQIHWLDNNQIENWEGGWSNFLNSGGHILVI